MKYQLVLLLIISFAVNAQIKFHPEFSFNKPNENDSLTTVQFFDSNNDGNEEIFANYENPAEKISKLVKYSSSGEFLSQSIFQIAPNEKHLRSILFKDNGKNYLFSVSSTSKEMPAIIDSQANSIRFQSQNFMSIMLKNFDTGDLIDTMNVYIGMDVSYAYLSFPNSPNNTTSLKLNKVNFITPVISQDGINLYLGTETYLHEVTLVTYGAQEYTSVLYKLHIVNGHLQGYVSYNHCGNDFCISKDQGIISSGYFRSFRDPRFNGQSTENFIWKLRDGTDSAIDAMFYITGSYYSSKYESTYNKFTTLFGSFFNNFPSGIEDYPLFYTWSQDSNDPVWNGPFLFYFSKADSKWDTTFGSFVKDQLQPAHTNMLLKDSTLAVIYFTKDHSYITLWMRRASDGKVIYSDSYAEFVPFSILKTTQDKLLFFNLESNGCTAYSMQGSDLIAGTEDEKNSLTPGTFELLQNYPNPFNSSTKISYSIPAESKVTLKIYDMLGKEIAILADDNKSAGKYTLSFDGSSLPSGIYLYRLDAGQFSSVKKFILLK